jgi:hypothetical protein
MNSFTAPCSCCLLLAAFGWDSCDKGGTWYKTIQSKVADLKVRHDRHHDMTWQRRRVLLLCVLTCQLLALLAGPDVHAPVAPTTQSVCVRPGESSCRHGVLPCTQHESHHATALSSGQQGCVRLC